MTEPEPTETKSRPQREALWQRAVVGALAALIATIGWLPTWLAYAVGDLVAVPWYLYWSVYDRRGRRSSGYWRNTMLAFREGAQLGPTRPERHLWRWSRHIAWIMVDFCRMRKITADNLRAHCDLEEYAQVQALYEEGDGVIFATGHVGVWDVSGYVAGLLGLPITSVFRPSPLPALNRLIERLRTGTGQRVVARKKVMWTLKRALEDKEAIGLLADGGGIYTLGFQPGTVLRSNYIHDVRRSGTAHGGAPNNGFFLDQGSKGFLLEGNVVRETSGEPVRFNQCERGWHRWRDNYFGSAAAASGAVAEVIRAAGPRSERR